MEFLLKILILSNLVYYSTKESIHIQQKEIYIDYYKKQRIALKIKEINENERLELK